MAKHKSKIAPHQRAIAAGVLRHVCSVIAARETAYRASTLTHRELHSMRVQFEAEASKLIGVKA